MQNADENVDKLLSINHDSRLIDVQNEAEPDQPMPIGMPTTLFHVRNTAATFASLLTASGSRAAIAPLAAAYLHAAGSPSKIRKHGEPPSDSAQSLPSDGQAANSIVTVTILKNWRQASGTPAAFGFQHILAIRSLMERFFGIETKRKSVSVRVRTGWVFFLFIETAYSYCPRA